MYFPEDSEIRENVPESQLQPIKRQTGFWNQPLGDFIGKEFYHNGNCAVRAKGTYSILSLGEGGDEGEDNSNQYHCERVKGSSGRGRKNAWFDVRARRLRPQNFTKRYQ